MWQVCSRPLVTLSECSAGANAGAQAEEDGEGAHAGRCGREPGQGGEEEEEVRPTFPCSIALCSSLQDRCRALFVLCKIRVATSVSDVFRCYSCFLTPAYLYESVRGMTRSSTRAACASCRDKKKKKKGDGEDGSGGGNDDDDDENGDANGANNEDDVVWMTDTSEAAAQVHPMHCLIAAKAVSCCGSTRLA